MDGKAALRKMGSIFLFLLPLHIQAAAIVTAKAIQENTYSMGMSQEAQAFIAGSLAQRQYSDAIDRLDKELLRDPKNISLLYKKAAIYADIEKYYQSIDVLDQIHRIAPKDEQSNKLREIVESKLKELPRNEIGYDQDEAYVSDLHSTWTSANVHYFRYTKAGNFGGRVNYAHRFGTNAEQYQVEAYPILFRDVSYLSLIGAYANSTQTLFPQIQYSIEDYINFKHGIEGSFGERMIHFQNVKIFTYTGSLGKYLGNYFIWFRPYIFVPYSQQSYELGIRRYFSTRFSYISLKVGAGSYPDIGQIQPVSQVVIFHVKAISADAQLPISKRFYIRMGLGLARQTFLTNRLRIIRNANFGVMMQF